MGKYLEKEKFVIAVCGTHGKSTTTAMIGLLLEDTGLDPTVELGAIVPKWKSNYRIPSRHPERSEGSIKYFVTEADEFNDNFLSTTPNITVVTNIEMDHPEYFADFEAVKQSFSKFLRSSEEKIIANMSDSGIKEVLREHPKGGSLVIDYSKKLINFPLQIPGDFNILNASAAYQVGIALGIDPEKIKKSLSSYTGLGRRFEYLGEFQEAQIYSDFAHHPTEIKVTMQAARVKFPDSRILLIYQPHMFSRTKALFDDFVKIFQEIPVDKIFMIDIYPSREIDTGEVSSKQLVDSINKSSVSHIGRGLDAQGGGTQTLEKIKPEIKKGDIVFFMGAGDSDKLARELISKE